MIVEDLKKSILNYAICGKLSTRKSSDTSVDEMIMNISKVREESIKSKVSKNDKYKSLDEKMMFEIPDSWKWVRVGEIGNWGSGSTPERSNSDYYNNGTISWLKTGELNDEYVLESEEKITDLALKKCSLKINKPGDVLIAMYGATIGKLGIVTVETTTNQACCGCSIYTDVNNKYLFYYLLGIRNKLISMGEGSGQPNISREKIINLPFPLPPIEEQERIVNAIDELFEKLDYIKPLEEELLSLKTKFPVVMKKSILLSALKGNLSENVKAEQVNFNRLDIKQYDIDEPFKIPDNWIWFSHNELFEIIGGSQPPKSKFSSIKKDGYVQLYQTRDYGPNPRPVYVDPKDVSKFSKKDDIILARYGGSLGKVFWAEDGAYNVALARVIIKYPELINKKYLYYYYLADIYQSKVKNGNRSAQAGFSKEDLNDMPFPLPPIEEQERIVDKIEELLPLCDDIERLVNE